MKSKKTSNDTRVTLRCCNLNISVESLSLLAAVPHRASSSSSPRFYLIVELCAMSSKKMIINYLVSGERCEVKKTDYLPVSRHSFALLERSTFFLFSSSHRWWGLQKKMKCEKRNPKNAATLLSLLSFLLTWVLSPSQQRLETLDRLCEFITKLEKFLVFAFIFSSSWAALEQFSTSNVPSHRLS